MKTITLTCLLTACLLAPAWAASPYAAPAGAGTVLTGEVLEVKDVEAYTYLRLKTKDGETWAAVSKAAVKKGDQVSIENTSVMTNFESHTLKKTFPSIVFGNLAGTGNPVGAGGGLSMGLAPIKSVASAPIKVARATGPNAHTVAEVVTQASALKDKPVKVSGQVIKYNPEIMGKNWIHLQDGSGNAAAHSNDILVTSTATAQVGDVITVTGVVRTEKDFGAGYAYKVLIEDATLSKP